MFIATTLNPDIGLTFPTTLRGLELGPYTKRAVNVFCQYTPRAAMSLHFHRKGINTSTPMSIKSKSGNTGKFHFKAVCMIAFGIDSLLVKQNIFNSLMPVLSLC